MNPNLAAILYLVAGVLFILALRGLSSPASSRQGNRFGMIGMAIAILTTLALSPPSSVFSWLLVILGFAIGGGIGVWRARTVQMTAMPQLVAMFHSLVGLAAVLVAAGALYAPHAFGIAEGDGDPSAKHHRNVARPRDRRGHLHRLDHRVPQARRAHVRRADPAAAAPRDQHRPRRRAGRPDRALLRDAIAGVLLADRARLARARRAPDRPDRRRGHAGRHLDAELLFRLGGGGHRLHPRQSRAHHHRRARRLVGRDPLLHHVQGHEPVVLLGHPRRFRRRGRSRGGRRRRRGRSSRARPRTRPS